MSYTNLRKFMIRDGFLRIAPEVFMRVTTSKGGAEKHFKRLENVAPKTGTIRVFKLTEKQYAKIFYLTGEPDYQEKIVGKNCHIAL